MNAPTLTDSMTEEITLSSRGEVLEFHFPLSERVRTWLRLEELFRRLRVHAGRREALDHRSALLALFDIAETASRGDLKTDLLQELDRQRALWSAQMENPEVEPLALAEFIRDIETASHDLHAQIGRPGLHLRDTEWLSQFRQRASSPGGACDLELPMLQAWLAQSESSRKADLKDWIGPLGPLEEATALLLRILRASAHACTHVAKSGQFQQALDGSRAPLLAILRVEAGRAVVPELSANRYAINIRWLEHGGQFLRSGRAAPTTQDVPFELGLCRL